MPVEVCSQCHNTTFHFDRAKHAIVCDVCGWEKNSSERASEMLVYDQYRQKAIAFVKARDYASAKPYLEKMRNIRPDDSDIYYLHLMGLTDCCQNLLLEPSDTQIYSQVQDHWSTFCSLHGDQRIFLQYFNHREQEFKKRYDKSILRATLVVAICYIPLLVFLAFAFAEFHGFFLPAIVLLIVIVTKRPLTRMLKMLFRNNNLRNGRS